MRVYSMKKKQDLSHYKIWDPDFYLGILSQQIRRVRLMPFVIIQATRWWQ